MRIKKRKSDILIFFCNITYRILSFLVGDGEAKGGRREGNQGSGNLELLAGFTQVSSK